MVLCILYLFYVTYSKPSTMAIVACNMLHVTSVMYVKIMQFNTLSMVLYYNAPGYLHPCLLSINSAILFGKQGSQNEYLN